MPGDERGWHKAPGRHRPAVRAAAYIPARRAHPENVVAHAQEVPAGHPAAGGRRGGHVGQLSGGTERVLAARLAQALSRSGRHGHRRSRGRHQGLACHAAGPQDPLVEFYDFDVPPVGGGEGPGDTTLATFDAFTPGGRRVGHTEGRFTIMFRDENFAEVTHVLDGRGRILVKGLAGPPTPTGSWSCRGRRDTRVRDPGRRRGPAHHGGDGPLGPLGRPALQLLGFLVRGLLRVLDRQPELGVGQPEVPAEPVAALQQGEVLEAAGGADVEVHLG